MSNVVQCKGSEIFLFVAYCIITPVIVSNQNFIAYAYENQVAKEKEHEPAPAVAP